MEKEKVYISGPISGLPIDKAKENFSRAEKRLLSMGYEVINPFNNGLDDTASWEDHMRVDIALMMQADTLCLLEGYEHSRGCMIEFGLATDLKYNIMYLQDMIL